MTGVFEKALKFVLKWEGGFVDHPSDSGGPTNFGITQVTYDSYRVKNKLEFRSVKDISSNEVVQIYKEIYWDATDCDKYEPALAIALFDTAVHSGRRLAKELLAESQLSWNKLIELRRSYLRNVGQGKNWIFLKGWMNRLDDLTKYLKTL